MGWRFRKSVKLLPGVRLNFSKSGVSTTLGSAPLSVNVGKKGVRRTVSIPGTGISHVQMASSRGGTGGGDQTVPQRESNVGGCLSVAIGLLAILMLSMCGSKSGNAPASELSSVSGQPAVPQTDPRPHYVLKGANCRRAPSIDTTVMDKFPAGKQIEVGSPVDGFYPTKTSDGLTCYVSEKLVGLGKGVGASQGASPQRLMRAPRTVRKAPSVVEDDGYCPCSGYKNCTGLRGGSFCYTRGGRKRYR